MNIVVHPWRVTQSFAQSLSEEEGSNYRIGRTLAFGETTKYWCCHFSIARYLVALASIKLAFETMNRKLQLVLIAVAQWIWIVCGFRSCSSRISSLSEINTRTTLFAHHPKKKIIKKIMDRRPKKKRLSDIGRTTANTGKCLTKMADLPPEFTIIRDEQELIAAQEKMNFFLTHGDPTAVWHEVDNIEVPYFPQNIDEPPEGRPKVVIPPYVRSRSLK